MKQLCPHCGSAIKHPRNVAHHRKFFAMMNLILQNQSHYKSMDDLLDVCKLRIGHVKTIETKDGLVRIPLSISFEAMDQAEFDDFYDRAVNWVLAEVIPGLKKETLEQELLEILL